MLLQSSNQSELLAQILAFDIDGEPVALPFAARLARENGWSREYADRVIAEYKHFVYLAVTSGITVCPSEEVDAAWHLHLTYTKSYWKRFCGELLNRPLHHEPTKGGAHEGDKHSAMYAKTLATYRDTFGHEPPADIWPAVAQRFGDDLKHRVVNTSRNWILPKAPIKRVAGFGVAFAVFALVAPGCDANPFEMKNKEFLSTVAVSLVGAIVVGRIIRSAMRKPNPVPGDENTELNWEQTAYLAGGAGRLMTAAIARLYGRALIKVTDDGKTLVNRNLAMDNISDVEQAVLKSLPMSNEASQLKPVTLAVEAAYAKQAEQLTAEGFTLSAGRQAKIVLVSLVPLAVVLLGLSLPRLLMGLEARRPVQYLVMLSLIGGIIAMVITLAGSLRLSNRGRAVLKNQLATHKKLQTANGWSNDADAGMAVALFGTAALAGSMMAPIQTWYPRQTTEASGGCGSGCGASGCGGGDGGGGGCGGGCGGGGD